MGSGKGARMLRGAAEPARRKVYAMTRSNVGWMLAGVLVAWLPLAASAATIEPVSQTRNVSAFADGTPGDPASAFFAASDFAAFNRTAEAVSQRPGFPFDQIHARIHQNSSIDDARVFFTMDGALFQSNLGGTGSVQTVFDVTFDLTLPSTYTIFTLIVRNGGDLQWTLTDSNDLVLAGYGLPGQSGTLAPGRYRINAQLDKSNLGVNGPDGSITGSLQFRVTPIPEPGTAALLALGLGALTAMRRGRGSAR